MLLNGRSGLPADVVEYLNEHYEIFLRWENLGIEPVATEAQSMRLGRDYDYAVRGLRSVLSNYTLRGYHCTKLHETEIAQILERGLSLPGPELLSRRLKLIQEMGLLTSDESKILLQKNEAAHSNRRLGICFIFYRPHIAGQRGIERFFRSWGGEALYNSHEDDPVTGPILRRIGTPCIIKAEIPVAHLSKHGGLEDKIMRRYLISRGLKTREPIHHEDRSVWPIPPESIRTIIRYPSVEFIRLTRCNSWSPPLD